LNVLCRLQVFDSSARDLFDSNEEEPAAANKVEIKKFPVTDVVGAVSDKPNEKKKSNKFKTFDLNFEELFSDELVSTEPKKKAGGHADQDNMVVNDTLAESQTMDASKVLSSTSNFNKVLNFSDISKSVK
jgi:hypothetical protein